MSSCLHLTRAAAAAVLSLAIVAMAAGPASAQQSQPGSPLGFFGRLFSPREVAPPPGSIPNTPRATRPQQKRPSGNVAPRKKQAVAPAEPAYAVVEATPKDADARKVLAIGDFMASGLAWGLDQAFADEPRITVLDRSEGSSGLVRDDHYDWAAMLPDLLAETKPDMIVVMIGSNDRQPIRVSDGRAAPRTEAWQKLYEERVSRFLLALQTYGKPVYWVGLPPLKSSDGSADMAYFNNLFKSRGEAVGAHFIDIWDGFADEEGRFVARGPDLEGQARQLRSGDGINFTKSGRRKLAFYVEREIRRENGIGTAIGAAAPLNPRETIEIGPDGKARTLGPVVSLTDAAAGPSSATLAGAPGVPTPVAAAEPPPEGPMLPSAVGSMQMTGIGAPAAGPGIAEGSAAPASEPESAAYRLTVEGVPPPSRPGRADDFAWRPPRPEAESAAGSGASVIDGIVILPASQPADGVAAR